MLLEELLFLELEFLEELLFLELEFLEELLFLELELLEAEFLEAEFLELEFLELEFLEAEFLELEFLLPAALLLEVVVDLLLPAFLLLFPPHAVIDTASIATIARTTPFLKNPFFFLFLVSFACIILSSLS